ncbi:MAG: 3-phosphoshikimate 1-carboxyvinyltransferase [Lentisphaeria bacterium]|nr:3-phosphoshikimate 1-carboxyvinyltransferase [Lentisphaeria bacterium]
MKLSVNKHMISGEVSTPGSKSHTIRALVIATLAKGTSIIKSPLVSADTLSCLSAVSALGAWIKRGDDSVWTISGTGGNMLQPAAALNMGNSGTGIKLLAAMASLSPHQIAFDGDESLRSRPMGPLMEALALLGVKSLASEGGKCPFHVQGPMQGGETLVEGKSSQYLSALLLSAPLAPKDSVIIVNRLNEIPYVDITLDWLRNQRIVFRRTPDYSRFEIPGKQSYKPFSVQIPGDFSSACFPLVAAAVTGGSLKLNNLDFTDSQGDQKVIGFMEQMGAKIIRSKNGIQLKAGAKLKAVELDLNDTPDALPILCVAAACAQGRSVFKNVAQARIKETDRIHCMKVELEKMGVKIEEFEDGLAVTGGKLHGAAVDSHLDHRIAMSLAVAGLAVENPKETTVIDGAECIAVTYPTFIRDFTALGGVFYEN